MFDGVAIIHIIRTSNYIKLLSGVLGLFCWVGVVRGEMIQVGDLLEISLKGVPVAEQAKVNSKLEVRDNGMIRVPMTHKDIRAAGRKPQDVERSIETAFKEAELYVAPTISIQVHRKKDGEIEVKKMLSVGGHVRRNGRVLFREGMTLLEAIQQAGGRNAFGSKFVHLTRKNAKGQSMRYKFNIKLPKHQVEKVYPNDVIHVPQAGPFERR